MKVGVTSTALCIGRGAQKKYVVEKKTLEAHKPEKKKGDAANDARDSPGKHCFGSFYRFAYVFH